MTQTDMTIPKRKEQTMELVTHAEHSSVTEGDACGLLCGYEPLMSVADASTMLGLTQPVVRQLCREEKMPSVKIGRRVYIPRDELERQIERDMRGKGACHE